LLKKTFQKITKISISIFDTRLAILIILLIGIMGIVKETHLMGAALHNIDQSFNELVDKDKINTILDYGSDFKTRRMVDYYIIGMNQYKAAYKQIAIFAFLIGYAISNIVTRFYGVD